METKNSISNESYLEYRKRVLDPISPTFCGAAFMYSSIWLYQGTTASCCHAPPHPIDLDLLATDESALHNTKRKANNRAELLKGIQTTDCTNCWKLENEKKSALSDRLKKSRSFSEKDIRAVGRVENLVSVRPKQLEIAFSNLCQFACAYCGPSISSRWEVESIQNKDFEADAEVIPYLAGYKTGAQVFHKIDLDSSPYMIAFWKWLPELHGSLDILRVTGGEPLLSPYFWQLLRELNQLNSITPSNLFFQVFTNLGHSVEKIEFLLEALGNVQPIEVRTSCDSTGAHAEYIRYGMNWNVWSRNFEILAAASKVKRLECSVTVTNLSIFHQIELFDFIVKMKQKYGRSKVALSVQTLDRPEILNINLLPVEIRHGLSSELLTWLEGAVDANALTADEVAGIENLNFQLSKGKEILPADHAVRKKALLLFLDQTDRRRERCFSSYLVPSCVNWINAITRETIVPKILSQNP